MRHFIIGFFALLIFSCFNTESPSNSSASGSHASGQLLLLPQIIGMGEARIGLAKFAAADSFVLFFISGKDSLRQVLTSLEPREFSLASNRPWRVVGYRVSGTYKTHEGMAGPVFISPGGEPVPLALKLLPLNSRLVVNIASQIPSYVENAVLELKSGETTLISGSLSGEALVKADTVLDFVATVKGDAFGHTGVELWKGSFQWSFPKARDTTFQTVLTWVGPELPVPSEITLSVQVAKMGETTVDVDTKNPEDADEDGLPDYIELPGCRLDPDKLCMGNNKTMPDSLRAYTSPFDSRIITGHNQGEPFAIYGIKNDTGRVTKLSYLQLGEHVSPFDSTGTKTRTINESGEMLEINWERREVVYLAEGRLDTLPIPIAEQRPAALGKLTANAPLAKMAASSPITGPTIRVDITRCQKPVNQAVVEVHLRDSEDKVHILLAPEVAPGTYEIPAPPLTVQTELPTPCGIIKSEYFQMIEGLTCDALSPTGWFLPGMEIPVCGALQTNGVPYPLCINAFRSARLWCASLGFSIGNNPSLISLLCEGATESMVLGKAPITSIAVRVRVPGLSGVFGRPQYQTYSSSGEIIPVTIPCPPCELSLINTYPIITLPTNGGSGTIRLQASSSACSWSAYVDQNFVRIAPSSGNGAGNHSIGLNVSPNTGGGRTATIRIDGGATPIDVMVAQTGMSGNPGDLPGPIKPPDPGASCGSVNFSPAQQAVPVQGGVFAFSVNPGQGCPWSLGTSDSWIQILGLRSGSGPATISYRVTGSNTPVSREGRITVLPGAASLAVVQGGTGLQCQFRISPYELDIPASGTDTTLQVLGLGSCIWEVKAPSCVSAYMVHSDGLGDKILQGQFNGSLRATVGANGSSSARTCTLVVAHYPVVFRQAGKSAPAPCVINLSPPQITLTSEAQNATFQVVTSQPNCSWNISSNSSWLSLSRPDEALIGTKTLSLTVLSTAEPRKGQIQVTGGGNPILDVIQQSGTDPIPCNVSISPTEIQLTSSAQSSSFQVFASKIGCNWRIVEWPTWVTFQDPTSNVVSQNVRFTVTATSAARNGVILLDNRSRLTLRQSGTPIPPSPVTVAQLGTPNFGPVSLPIPQAGTHTLRIEVTSGTAQGWVRISRFDNPFWTSVAEAACTSGDLSTCSATSSVNLSTGTQYRWELQLKNARTGSDTQGARAILTRP